MQVAAQVAVNEATKVANIYDWYEEPDVETPWLVYGLIPADGYSAVVGKPKAGKSTFIRNLAVAVIKGHDFLGRAVRIAPNTGKVLYLQLDRKDKPGRVSAQFKSLGLTRDEAPRLTVRLAEHLPKSKVYADRLRWIEEEVKSADPTLIVIDLMWQFVMAKNSNDFTAVLDGINDLQDSLNAIGYKGALIAVIHGRKATNVNDQFDDFLGSTAQRGSFSTNIMLTQYKRDKRRTIASDQSDIEERIGEIPETVILQNPDGTLVLGQPVSELAKADKAQRAEQDLSKALVFIEEHPGAEMDAVIDGLGMSKKHVLELIRLAGGMVSRTGRGIKGDPHRYFIKGYAPMPNMNHGTEEPSATIN